jgi:hypothetical protein
MAVYIDTCDDCALAYYDSRERMRPSVWFVIGFGLPWLAYAALYEHLPAWSARSGGFRAITTGVPALDVLVIFAITAVFAGRAMVGLRSWLHRRSFMTGAMPRATLHVR